MKYIAVADQKELLNAVAQEAEYQDVDIETARLLKEVVGVKIKMNDKKEVNMCKALQDMTDEARADGMQQELHNTILKMYKKSKTPQEIADLLDLELCMVEAIITK